MKKIKKWSAKARKWAKEYGTMRVCGQSGLFDGVPVYKGIACLLDCSRQHASGMINGSIATTPENAEKLRREARAQGWLLSVEDFGQPAAKKEAGR